MDEMSQLRGLLRLKAYERPPSGYHERFLKEFQRRQRAAWLRAPGLVLWWEAFLGLWPNFEVPRVAYATAALVAALAGAALWWNPPQQDRMATASPVTASDFSLMKPPVFIRESLPVSQPALPPAPSRHFVLQPLPAYHEAPLSF